MNYSITIGDTHRELPIMAISQDTAIASFVLLGDDELSNSAAKQLLPKLPKDFDYIVTMESKGIPLAHDLSLLTNHPRSIVIRKSVKDYMKDPLTTPVKSITTGKPQELVLNGEDARLIKGKKIILVDDVVSTGGSMKAASNLLQQVNANIIARVAILAEGDAAKRKDLIYLQPLPLFNLDGSIK